MDITDRGKRSMLNTSLIGASEPCRLMVSNLAYKPAKTVGGTMKEAIVSRFPYWEFPAWQRMTTNYMKESNGMSDKETSSVAPLTNVTFSANASKITAIVSSTYGERRSIIDLISCRRKRGTYDGEVYLGGGDVDPNSSLSMNMAFVPRKSLYIPGFTYAQMLRYAARQRMTLNPNGTRRDVSGLEMESQVQEVLRLMDLYSIQDRVLPDDPADRGVEAGDLRRLSIAVEIVALPPLVIIDDPTVRLEPAVAVDIMASLRRVAERGCIVVLAMPSPSPQILACIDKLVVVGRGGFSIYAAAPQDLKTYFCSSSVGYVYEKQNDIMGWVLEIANGVERPQNAREAVNMYAVQEIFQSSPFFTCNDDIPTDEHHILSAFEGVEAHQNTLGYCKNNLSASVLIYRIFVTLLRAVHAKVLERDILRKSVVSSIIVGAWIGYLEYGVGQYGYDCMNLIKVPYVNTSNVTALLFFIPAFIFTQQVLNVQLICRKVSVYRQEQQSGYCGAAAFGIATFISEVPFQAFYAVLFGTVVYFLAGLHLGYHNFYYYCQVLACTAILGVMTAFSYAVLFRAEVAVRDLFLFTVFAMLLLSGFPFQFSVINPHMLDLSITNPTRWTYEALMTWKFNSGSYHDGSDYLQAFGFSTFNAEHVFEYYQTFFIINGVITALLLFDKPNLMERRKRRGTGGLYGRYSGDSEATGGGSSSGRPSSLDKSEREAWLSDQASEELLGKEEGGGAARRGDRAGIEGSMSQIMTSGSFSEREGAGGIAATAAADALRAGGNGGGGTEGRNSFDMSAFPRMKTNELASPALFFRESSVSGSLTHRNSLRSHKSLSDESGPDGSASSRLAPIYSPFRRTGGGHLDEMDLINRRGPNVSFANVSYRGRNRERISGYESVLSDVSGEFQWGKLGCIMGGPQCGKTTLLHVLAGSTAFRSNVEGTILYDNMRPDPNVPLWRRCALVEEGDRHLPDLTVLESITYAMSLRRGIYTPDTPLSADSSGARRNAELYARQSKGLSKARDSMGNLQRHGADGDDNGDEEDLNAPPGGYDAPMGPITTHTGHDLAENVKYALASLYLTPLSHKKVKHLTPGERRRLSIAEECVIFPSLLLIDEPCTALGLLDESVLLRAFREMVNNDKTVVCTLHQPSQQAFALFDTMLLLSKGCVVYHGPVDGAVDYFTSAPCSFTFDSDVYSNSAEFLVDISGGYLPNKHGKYLWRETLVEYYRSSTTFVQLMRRLSELYHSVAPLWAGVNYATSDEGDVASTPGRARNSMAMGSRLASKDGSVISLGHDSLSDKDSKLRALRTDSDAEAAFLDRPLPVEEARQRAPASDYLTRCLRGFAGLCAMATTALIHGVNDLCVFFSHANTRREALRNAATLLSRSCWSLWRRQTLFWGIIVTQVLLALVLSVILGDASGSIYNVTSFFAVAALLLMLSSVQLISYLFEMNQHFLKEHTRGMYSCFLYWLVTLLPMYVLRGTGAVLFSLITYRMLNLTDDEDLRLYYYITTVVLVLATTMLAEAVIYLVPNLRAAYILIPALSFIQFSFSGLMLKPCLLPTWVAPWAPSSSVLRWVLQGQFMNYFQESALFPALPGYDTYTHFLTLYGWGGKSKWYCLSMLFVFMAVFKVLALGSLVLRSSSAKGGRL